MKAAVVDVNSSVVVNVIMVDSLGDPVPEGQRLVEVGLIEIVVPPDPVDPPESPPEGEQPSEPDPVTEPVVIWAEPSITIGWTRWTEELGFHDPVE